MEMIQEQMPNGEDVRHADGLQPAPPAAEGFAGRFASRWPLLAGLGETSFSALFVMWSLAALLMIMKSSVPLVFGIPCIVSLLTAWTFVVRNAIRRQWLRFAGDIVGLLLAVPVGFFGFMYLGFLIQGVP